MPASRYLFGTIPFYSVLIVSGMVIAILLASREEKRRKLPKDTIVDLALILIPVSVVCARLYYVLFAWDSFRDHLLSIFAIWEGGIAIYGGLIGGILTVLVFARFRHISPLLLFDILAPGVALAQAIGRWGNFFNMEAYGLPVDNPALQFFPFAVQIPEGGTITWHLATFFYESCWNFLIFLILFSLRRRVPKHGMLFLLYSLLYAAGRLVIEELRTDSLMAGQMRISQLLGFLVCLGVLIWLLIWCRPHKPDWYFWPLLILQPVLFVLLPRPHTENLLAPFFLAGLACFFPCVLTSSVHNRVLKALASFLCIPFWLAYAFLAPISSFCCNLTYSIAAVLLCGILSMPLLCCPATEVHHANDAAA